MSGWIKYHRKSLDNPLFKKPDIWHYWEYCLLKANHDPSRIIWNQKEMVVERGSFITGRKMAAKATGLSERKIRTAITTLVNLNMISINKQKSTSKFTYLTICNYNKYNDNNIGGDQQTTSKRPANDQQVTTNKNVKNDKNEKKESKTLYTEVQEIFNYWNSQEIIQHREIENFIPEIGARLKYYTVEEIKEAIKNYATILNSEDYLFSYRWSLKDFLGRKKDNISRFMNKSKPFESCQRTLIKEPDPSKRVEDM